MLISHTSPPVELVGSSHRRITNTSGEYNFARLGEMDSPGTRSNTLSRTGADIGLAYVCVATGRATQTHKQYVFTWGEGTQGLAESLERGRTLI